MIKQLIIVFILQVFAAQAWYKNSKVNLLLIDFRNNNGQYRLTYWIRKSCICKVLYPMVLLLQIIVYLYLQRKDQYEELYEKVMVQKRVDNVTIARVNCDDQKDICQYFNILGYPTLQFFTANTDVPVQYPFDYGKNSESMVRFIDSNIIDYQNALSNKKWFFEKDQEGEEEENQEDKQKDPKQYYEEQLFSQDTKSFKCKLKKNNILIKKIDHIAEKYNSQIKNYKNQIKLLKDSNKNKWMFINLSSGLLIGYIIVKFLFIKK